jgi:hypothetical protein
VWLRTEGLRWPLQKLAHPRRGGGIPEITWVEPTYHAVHTTLTHPAYAGATGHRRGTCTGALLRLDGSEIPVGLGRDGDAVYINLEFLDGTRGGHVSISVSLVQRPRPASRCSFSTRSSAVVRWADGRSTLRHWCSA